MPKSTEMALTVPGISRGGKSLVTFGDSSHLLLLCHHSCGFPWERPTWDNCYVISREPLAHVKAVAE